MKTLLLALAFLAGTTAFAHNGPTVNEKVLRSFEQTFKDAKEVIWQEFTDSYVVDFKLYGTQATVRYDENGNIIRYLRYYGENQLPIHILVNLKKKYPDRAIFGVTEYFNENDWSYIIQMQDSKHWYTVKSDVMGNLEQTKKLNNTE